METEESKFIQQIKAIWTLEKLNNSVKYYEEIVENIKDRKRADKLYCMNNKTSDLDGENFLPLDGYEETLEVSNFGRVRKIGGNICKQTIKKIDTCYVSGISESVHRLVAKTWLINEEAKRDNYKNWEVHHISNDGLDNRPENLLWVRKDEHGMIKHKTYKNLNNKKVIDEFGKALRQEVNAKTC